MNDEIKNFYENFPYPSKIINSKVKLYRNALWLTKLVGKRPDEFNENEKILEAGCGTGEFSCGFGLSKAKVIGIDISENSIKRAKSLAKRFNLRNVEFLKMDIMNNSFEKESFDYVFSVGVLHHCNNPEKAFEKLVELVKPNGFIVVGLYNKYSRFPVVIRRMILDIFVGKDIERRINLANKLFYKNRPLTKEKRIWFADKYCNPLEHSVSFEEVLDWFGKNNVKFYSSKPEVKSLDRFSLITSQISWMFDGLSFFTVAGQKIKL
ncbi:MAG: class I SAM-dependent methyltransferase [Candidatus Diapherotrites archaeon]|nr:class I SAM-dependent methyltransferase [Candidatus Diapherotrites archaeon]